MHHMGDCLQQAKVYLVVEIVTRPKWHMSQNPGSLTCILSSLELLYDECEYSVWIVPVQNF